jgi:hypothetical protein
VIGVVNILKLIHVEISSFEILNIITFNEERLHRKKETVFDKIILEIQ